MTEVTPEQEPEKRQASPPAPKLEWIDSHTHLEHEYPFSVDEYLANARAQGVRAFITIGTEPGKLARLKEHAELYPDVFFTVGIHPHEAKFLDTAVEAEMARLRAHPKCVAVGEIGLDYFYGHSPRDAQLRALSRQLELARQWRKPVVIHARDAEDDLLRELTKHADARAHAAVHAAAGGETTNLKPSRVNSSLPEIGVIHCFSGTRHFAEECLKLGFYISFSGIVTFKTAGALR
ncbi:MAG: TatD family hydrolase, partial [Deltaproteobacteria bacterium]|nr:TatD family hydrolase [Deltaproteobacteria bacterium]